MHRGRAFQSLVYQVKDLSPDSKSIGGSHRVLSRRDDAQPNVGFEICLK